MKWNWHGIHSDLVESIGIIYLEIIIDSNNNIIHVGHWHGFSKIYCPFYFATISAGKCLFVQNEQKKNNVLLFHCSHFGQLNHSVVCLVYDLYLPNEQKRQQKQTQLHVLELSKYAIYGIQSDILAKKVNNNKIRRFHNIFSTQFNIACRTRQKATRHIQRPKRNRLHVLKGANEETKTPATAISRN